MMHENFKIGISFYCYCSVRQSRYHHVTNPYESNAVSLEQVDIGIDEENLVEKIQKYLMK